MLAQVRPVPHMDQSTGHGFNTPGSLPELYRLRAAPMTSHFQRKLLYDSVSRAASSTSGPSVRISRPT